MAAFREQLQRQMSPNRPVGLRLSLCEFKWLISKGFNVFQFLCVVLDPSTTHACESAVESEPPNVKSNSPFFFLLSLDLSGNLV